MLKWSGFVIRLVFRNGSCFGLPKPKRWLCDSSRIGRSALGVGPIDIRRLYDFRCRYAAKIIRFVQRILFCRVPVINFEWRNASCLGCGLQGGTVFVVLFRQRECEDLQKKNKSDFCWYVILEREVEFVVIIIIAGILCGEVYFTDTPDDLFSDTWR